MFYNLQKINLQYQIIVIIRLYGYFCNLSIDIAIVLRIAR